MPSLEIPIVIYRTLKYWADKDEKEPSELAEDALDEYLASYQDKYDELKRLMVEDPNLSFDEGRRKVNFWNDPEYDESVQDKPWDSEPETAPLDYSERIDKELSSLSNSLKDQPKLTFVTEALDEYLEGRYLYESLTEEYGEDFDFGEGIPMEEVMKELNLDEDEA